MLDHFDASRDQKSTNVSSTVSNFFPHIGQSLMLNNGSLSSSSSSSQNLHQSATSLSSSTPTTNSTPTITSSNQVHDTSSSSHHLSRHSNGVCGGTATSFSSEYHSPRANFHQVMHMVKHEGTSSVTDTRNVSAFNYTQSNLHQSAVQHSLHPSAAPVSSCNSDTNSLKHHIPNNSTSVVSAVAVARNFDSSHLLSSQSAASMNMWKNHQLSGFFGHSSDLSNISPWSHSGGLTHQAAALQHSTSLQQHSLDMGYAASAAAAHHHHSRNLQIPSQELIGGSAAVVKSPSSAATVAEQQASFMLHTMGHQSAAVGTAPSVAGHHHHNHSSHTNSHHAKNHLGSFNLRPHHQDAASYNFPMSETQFYHTHTSRTDLRSLTPSLKPSFFMHERPDQAAASNYQSQGLNYQSLEHSLAQQPSTSASMLAVAAASANTTKTTNTFQCNICGQVFPLKNVYQSHMKTHSQNKAKFLCQLCGSTFSQKTSLNRHMKSHTGERPFSCNLCTKSFSEKERLKIHMRTHTGEKPFECQVCGKAFSQKSTVKRHQTVHTGEKKFRCDCGKGFANRGNLIAHIKTRGGKHHTS